MKPWPRWRAYVLAVTVTAAVLLMRVLAEPWMGHRPFLLVFLLPVILAAYMGGLRPGLFATALSGVSTKLFVFPPFNRAWFDDNQDFAHWLFLLLVGVLISMLFDELQQWRDKTGVRSTERQHAATERKVRVGFAIAMAFLGAIGIVSFLSVVRLSENARLVAHSQLVMSNIDSLVATTFENE
jgi:K+-sensing histidine kinase KdpD